MRVFAPFNTHYRIPVRPRIRFSCTKSIATFFHSSRDTETDLGLLVRAGHAGCLQAAVFLAPADILPSVWIRILSPESHEGVTLRAEVLVIRLVPFEVLPRERPSCPL